MSASDGVATPVPAVVRSLEDLINVAPEGAASQSSISPWSREGEAADAASGVVSGDFAFHTQLEDIPWWEIDLKQVYPIEAILVHNRILGHQDRARTLKVEIAEQPGQWILIHAGFASFGARGSGYPLELWIESQLAARYVRVSLREAQYLHLSQVEIFVRQELIALDKYLNQYRFDCFNRHSTDFGRPYRLEKAPGAPSDRIVGLRLNHSGRFGNLTLQYTHVIELARQTGLKYIQLGFHDLFDVKASFVIDDITFLPHDVALPPVGLFITGVFFNSDIFSPYLCAFLRFSPEDERVYSSIAQTYLRRHLLTGIPLPDERHYDDEVTIHMRSGDLFDNSSVVETMYRQPPLSFYTLVIDRLRELNRIGRVRLVFEDRGNPCIERLESWLIEHEIPFRVQSGTLHEDMSALIDAPHLVFGYGTFGYAACRLSKRIETVHFFAPELGGKYGFIPSIQQVFAVSDNEGRYIRAGEWGHPGQGEWRNTPEQRDMMVTYPSEWLRVDELPSSLRRPD